MSTLGESADSERRYPAPAPYVSGDQGPYVTPTIVDEGPRRRNWGLPLMLFIATCVTTSGVGGPLYALAIMTILLSHELGHFFQALRYRVPASLPIFIPIPAGPLGTMGAVIFMRGGMGNRKALFDIGITGPLVGLVPAVLCCIIGLMTAQVMDVHAVAPDTARALGEPLLFQFLEHLIVGPVPPGHDVFLGPVGYAGWVGLFITALNLIPISQLDGGHILYALLRKKSYPVTTLLLALAVLAVVWTRTWVWSLMLLLLYLIGPKHPPTADDNVPLGTGRIVLGWLTLLFVIVGFTPRPGF